MIELKGTVNNPLGIHCRPADLIRKSVADYTGKIEIVASNGMVATPHKVLSILSLALVNGDNFSVRVTGPDEERTAQELVEKLEATYDFDSNS